MFPMPGRRRQDAPGGAAWLGVGGREAVRQDGGGQFAEGIDGRVAVVVGAAGGIGRACARRLAAAGARLALLDADESALEAVREELASAASPQVVRADVTDRGQVDRAAEAVRSSLGGADILVNAAGINTKQRTLADISPEQWESVIGVNLNGVFHCTQAFLPMMIQGGGGIIVTIVSTASPLVSPGAGAHYCAAKRALLSLTESINIEHGRNGIRACAISPGEVDTSFVDHRPEVPSAERRATMLKAGDVAEAVYYVVTRPARVTISDLVIWPSAQISGQTVI
jgi:NAD(P)-dependent dehydrogenase (short-subunit alcohol dehydrogenase family)